MLQMSAMLSTENMEKNSAGILGLEPNINCNDAGMTPSALNNGWSAECKAQKNPLLLPDHNAFAAEIEYSYRTSSGKKYWPPERTKTVLKTKDVNRIATNAPKNGILIRPCI